LLLVFLELGLLCVRLYLELAFLFFALLLRLSGLLLGFVFVPLQTLFTATDFLCRLLRSAIRLSAYLCC
jgi:hypothetical protein